MIKKGRCKNSCNRPGLTGSAREWEGVGVECSKREWDGVGGSGCELEGMGRGGRKFEEVRGSRMN